MKHLTIVVILFTGLFVYAQQESSEKYYYFSEWNETADKWGPAKQGITTIVVNVDNTYQTNILLGDGVLKLMAVNDAVTKTDKDGNKFVLRSFKSVPGDEDVWLQTYPDITIMTTPTSSIMVYKKDWQSTDKE